MIILELFIKNRVCTHDRIRPDLDFCYCPDCGQLIENQWFITRCACCGVKLKATIRNGEVVPEEHFCKNCGAKNFVVEKLDKINFLNIDYAVIMKKVVTPDVDSEIQSWVDINSNVINPKLISKVT